jgi:hypothetical protein
MRDHTQSYIYGFLERNNKPNIQGKKTYITHFVEKDLNVYIDFVLTMFIAQANFQR